MNEGSATTWKQKNKFAHFNVSLEWVADKINFYITLSVIIWNDFFLYSKIHREITMSVL